MIGPEPTLIAEAKENGGDGRNDDDIQEKMLRDAATRDIQFIDFRSVSVCVARLSKWLIIWSVALSIDVFPVASVHYCHFCIEFELNIILMIEGKNVFFLSRVCLCVLFF